MNTEINLMDDPLIRYRNDCQKILKEHHKYDPDRKRELGDWYPGAFSYEKSTNQFMNGFKVTPYFQR